MIESHQNDRLFLYKETLRYIVVWMALLFTFGVTFISELNAQELKEEDLAVLDMVYERQLIGNGLDVYLTNDGFYTPLIDFVVAMEMNVSVTKDGALGRINESETFELKRADGAWVASANGTAIGNYQEGRDVLLFDGLLFVKNQLITTWFGVDLDLIFNESILKLKFNKPLPVVERLKRQSQKIGEQNYLADAEQPLWYQPYALVEVPSLESRVSYVKRRSENTDAEDATAFYSLRTVGDLLGMNTRLFLTGEHSEGMKGGSIVMERFDNERGMLGVLGVSQISIGDVRAPNTGLSVAGYGRGILIGNEVSQSGVSRDVRTIEGEFYPGWEVELYLGEALLGYQVVNDEGFYRFDDLVVFEGRNEFTLKFYGPFGEKEIQKRQIIIGDDPKNNNPFRYSVSILQPRKSTLNIGEQEAGYDGDYSASFNSGVRVNSALTFNFGVQKTRVSEEVDVTIDELDDFGNPIDSKEIVSLERTYFRYGMNAQIGRVNLGLTGGNTDDGLKNYSATLNTNMWGTEFRVFYNTFGYPDELKQSMIDEGDVAFKPENNGGFAINRQANFLSFALSGDFQNFDAGKSSHAIAGFSLPFGKVSWNNNLEYWNQELNDEFQVVSQGELTEDDPERALGNSFLSYSNQTFDARMGISYTVRPEFESNVANFSFNYRFDSSMNAEFSTTQSLHEGTNYYRLGLSWTNDNFRLTPAISYTDDGRWQGIVQLTSSFGKRSGRLGNYYQVASNPSVTRGAARIRLFEDRNADGKYQIGESLLSGGEVEAVQARRKVRSNAAGIALLDLLPSWRRTDINIDANSINESYVVLAKEPFSLVPRPGRIVEIDIPFSKVGEIDGHINILDGINEFPGLGIPIELLDSKGEVIAKTRSDSNSYFVFPAVKPGSYTVVTPEHILVSANPKNLVITAEGNYIDGIKVLVELKPLPLEDEVPSSEPVTQSFNGVEQNNISVVTEVSEPVAPIFDVVTVNSPVESAKEHEVAPKEFVENSQLVTPTSEASFSESLWDLQLASYANRGSADKMQQQIRDEGFNASCITIDLAKGRFYRVIATGFIDEATARDAKAYLDGIFKTQSIVRKSSDK